MIANTQQSQLQYGGKKKSATLGRVCAISSQKENLVILSEAKDLSRQLRHPIHRRDHVRAQHRCAPSPQNHSTCSPLVILFLPFQLSTVDCQLLPRRIP